MITLDEVDLIDSLSTGDYTITRTVTGTYVNHIAVPGSVTTLPITAAVYQATGRDLLMLPEARRSVAQQIIFTVTRLYTGAEQGTGSEATYEADKITIAGVVHEIHTAGAWPGYTGFWRCVGQAVA